MFSLIKILKEKKGLILFTGMRLLNIFLALVINYMIVARLSTKEFGIFSLVIATIGFLNAFGFSWVSSSLLYFGAVEKIKNGNMRSTFWSKNLIIFMGVLVTGIVFALFNNRISSYIGIKVNNFLFLWLLVKIMLDTLNTYFLAVKKQIISIMVLFLGRVIFIFFMMLLNFNLEKLILINIICEATGIIFMMKVDFKDLGKPIFDKEKFNEVLNFGLWQLFGFSGLYLINFGDNFVIKYFLTVNDVAVYNVAYKLFNAIAGLSLIFSSYYAPIFLQALEMKEKEKIKIIFYRDRIFLNIMILIPHVIVILLSNKIIEIIYGIRYIEAGNILRVLMFASYVRFLTVFNVLIFNGMKKYKILQIINIFQAILNILFDIYLIKKFGLIGAAYGTLIGIVISRFITVVYCEKIIYYLSFKFKNKESINV